MSRKPNNQFKFSNILCFFLIIPCFIFISLVQSFASTQVSLEWNPNRESDLAGYRVFSHEKGKSYDYTHPVWEGTTNYCTIYNIDETKNYYFVARAVNTSGLESGNSNEVYLESTPAPVNQAPAANAGPNQIVEEGKIVTLNGSNSTDPDDGIASYHWAQTEGSNVNLINSSNKVATFTAPDIGTVNASLKFELTVVDHSGLESTDSCIVNITGQNEPPQADAGVDQTVNEGDIITLDGSSSVDIDGGIASYYWTQTGGPDVFLYDPTSSQPTFTAPNAGQEGGACLTFNLTVTDTYGLQNSDSCVVNVSGQNKPPTAILAADYIEAPAGTTVTLDGSKSTDPDNDIASYLWTQVNGNPVNLSDPKSKITTFLVPETVSNGTNLTFKLTVTDSGELKGTADCIVYVTDAPESGKTVTLEAEDMPTKTTGGATSGGWNIWSNGYVAENVDFPVEGNHTFEIWAKGSLAGGAWPKMEIRIDQTVVGSVTVDSSEWTLYTIETDVTSGIHEIAVAFTNDYYKPPEDRNLYVDKMTIYLPDAPESGTTVSLTVTDDDGTINSQSNNQTFSTKTRRGRRHR